MAAMAYSITDWWRLDRHQRQQVGVAVDRGQPLEDPRLREIAVATASAHLKSSGWRSLRQPVPMLASLIGAMILLISGFWWLLLVLVLISTIGLWITEQRAQTLRPYWHAAIAANRSPENGEAEEKPTN